MGEPKAPLTDKLGDIMLWGFIRSRKLAYWLIILLTALSIAGSFLPHPTLLDTQFYDWQKNNPILAKILAALYLEDFYQSWLYLSVVILLLLNTFFCTWDQIVRVKGLFRWYAQEGQVPGYAREVRGRILPAQLPEILAKLGYQTKVTGDGLLAQKGKLGALGMIIFHGSFLVIAIGAFLYTTVSYEGRMVIAEGQRLTESRENYVALNESLWGHYLHQGFEIQLDKFSADFYPAKTADNFQSRVTILEQGEPVTKGLVKEGRFFRYRGAAFFADWHGFVPKVQIFDHRQKKLLSGFIILDNNHEIHKDTVYPPGSNREVRLELIPESKPDAEGGLSRVSNLPKSPALGIDILEEGKLIAKGWVRLGEKKRIPLLGDKGEYLEIMFPELRQWGSYIITNNAGTEVLFWGSWLGIAGLVLFYSQRYLRIHCKLKTGDNGAAILEIYGCSNRDKFRLAEEIEAIGSALDFPQRIAGKDEQY